MDQKRLDILKSNNIIHSFTTKGRLHSGLLFSFIHVLYYYIPI